MRTGIIGLGLIGGSLAAALTRAGYEVHGSDIEPGAVIFARERGWIVGDGEPEAIAGGSDVVVLCARVNATIRLIREVGPLMRREAVLTDVCSVKRPVIQAMDGLAEGPRCVGGHPMAGRAAGGIEHAEPDLFLNAPWAVVPSQSTDRRSREKLGELIAAAGARPVEIDAARHDEQVALISHLPQLIATALSLATNGGHSSELSGPGLRSMLRLAGSDGKLWGEILAANAENVESAGERFLERFQEALEAVLAQDPSQIGALIDHGREYLA